MRTTPRSTLIAAVQIAALGGALFTGISAGAAGPVVRPTAGPAAHAAPGAVHACIPNKTGHPLPSPPFCPQLPPPPDPTPHYDLLGGTPATSGDEVSASSAGSLKHCIPNRTGRALPTPPFCPPIPPPDPDPRDQLAGGTTVNAPATPSTCIPNRSGRDLPSPPFCPPPIFNPKPFPNPHRGTPGEVGNGEIAGAGSNAGTTSIPCYSPLGGATLTGPGPIRICPPPPPPPPANELVDTNSAQTIYGAKTFLQPIAGDLDGVAAYAYEFSGELSGDVVGTQYDTRIANVSASALPSIGFGVSAGPRIKYVFADADANDSRADGSLTHPYSSLAQAAQGAHSGDRIILHGTLNGSATFNAVVTLEGAGPDQTTLYGSVDFAGYGSSMIRNLRVNCTSADPCVNNRAINGGALRIENVIVTQSENASAVATRSGPLTINRSEFTSTGGGSALTLAPYAIQETRVSDSTLRTTLGGAALYATYGAVRIDNTTLESNTADPAIQLIDVPRFMARGITAASAGGVLRIRNSRSVLVFNSTLIPGSLKTAVAIDNDPIVTFAVDRNPGLVFAGNTIASDAPEVFSCTGDSVLMTSGNLLPLFAAPSGTDPKITPVTVGGCQQTTYAGF